MSNLEYKKDSLLIDFKIVETERRYCGPDCFASLIGVLAQCGVPYLCTGNTHKDGTGFPSLSHINGYAFDFKNQPANDQKLINAFEKFQCKKFCMGTNFNYTVSEESKMGQNAGHNSHLHCGPMDNIKVTEQKD